LALVRIDDPLSDRQAETGPAALARASLVRAVEALEDVRQIATRDPFAGIGHRDVRPSVLTDHTNPDLATRRRMGQGVVDQDQQELTHSTQVGVDPNP